MPEALSEEVIDTAISFYLSGMNTRDAAAKAGLSKSSLIKYLGLRNIGLRSKGEVVAEKFKNAPWRDKRKLTAEYVENNKSSVQLASEWNCDKSVILDWLNRFGIETRDLSESHLGNEPPNKGKGKRNSDEMVECACGCGEMLKRYGWGSNERTFIHGHRLKGADHPLYKPHSVNRQPRHDRSDYRLWRKAVLEACDFTCQRCEKRGGKLHSHHIKPMAKYPDLAFDVDNGQALCIPCHKEVHKELRESSK